MRWRPNGNIGVRSSGNSPSCRGRSWGQGVTRGQGKASSSGINDGVPPGWTGRQEGANGIEVATDAAHVIIGSGSGAPLGVATPLGRGSGTTGARAGVGTGSSFHHSEGGMGLQKPRSGPCCGLVPFSKCWRVWGHLVVDLMCHSGFGLQCCSCRHCCNCCQP